jgi:tetratricopeptide (TPR) repeat protein
VSHGKASAWLPVLELLHGYFGLRDADDATTRREKVSAALATLDPTLSDALPYLLTLLGIQEGTGPLAQADPQVKRRRTFDAIKRIIVRESLNQPTLVIFEDLHWIDSETQELLDLLADSVASARILMLVNYRPEYHHEWGNRTFYTQLRLAPLGGQSADEMLDALLGGDASLQSLKRLIIEKTEGNPFFMEEIVRALVEQGVLFRNGATRLTRPLTEIRIPPTVQGILASRIDALPVSEKGLLQTLAVIGKGFPLNLVRHITSAPDDRLEPMLKSLQAGEFIYEQAALGEAEYTFKHALTQEVAYNSMLMERRRLFHERTGDAIEAQFKARIDDHLAELAHHYSRSTNLRKAVHYLGRAGNQALERAAYAEAQALLKRALELLKELPDDAERAREEICLQTALGWSLSATGDPGGPEREATVVRTRELCERLGDAAGLIEAFTDLAHFRINRLELQPARELAEQALTLTEYVDDPGLAGRIHHILGKTLFFLGALVASREHSERALELFGPRPYRNFAEAECARWSAYYSIAALGLSGYPDTMLERSRQFLSAARRSADPAFIGVALIADTEVSRYSGDIGKVLERAEELLALSGEHDMTLLTLNGAVRRSSALAAQGQVEQGIAELKRVRQAVAAYPLLLLFVLFLLAEVHVQGSRPDEGLEVVAEALALARNTGAEVFETGLYIFKGELLLLHGTSNAAEAEGCFRQAIQIAQGQSCKLAELNATRTLARLLATQRRHDEARETLAQIYGWFSEGFDTPVLKQAKALLDELNP